MTVRKRGEHWLVDFWFTAASGRRERIRKASPVNTKRGAVEYERQLRCEQLDPTRPNKEVTFKEYAKEFEEIYVKANLKWATQIAYASTLRVHLVPEFGSVLIEDIGTQRIERFKAKLVAGGRSNSTVRNTLGVLSRALHVARDWGYLRELPRFYLPKVPAPRIRFLTQEEVEAVFKHAGPYWYPPIYFALMTGCRMGELWAMERDQIDLANAVVHIDRAVFRGKVGLPKHDKIRSVELSPKLVAFLKDHLKVIPLRERLVFPKPEGGMRLERKADTGIRRAAQRAGVETFGWHVLRHTFASHLVMRGVPLQAVQQLLGHARIDETMRYAHLSPHMKRQAVAKLDELTAAEAENFGHSLGTREGRAG